MRRGVVLSLGFVVVAVGAFVVLDRFGGTDRFADLPGEVDVRFKGSFTAHQVDALAALPQAAAVECASTLYGVKIFAPTGTLPGSTVLTAVRSPGLRRTTVLDGQYPASDSQLLVDEQTAARHGVRIGQRVSLERGGHVVPATVVGIAGRPADGSAGASEAVAVLPAGGITKLAGGAPCDEVAVQLRRRSEATAFQKAAYAVLGTEPGVTYDDSLRGHV
ncbi:ABC transporter permease [Dactylosporangium fulvum]|uniref:ABC transporter permease n=1 Tax=Dactylosporangium fulvum TaxID=53359 RepID=A0ABY5VYK0_9ACTN|nr:ABC transporter permease [Dactylosporangium fulvum]UWP81884.1 ABC transporter permease [Dactylosporangium fulvum]